ncbi:MAG: Glyoxylase, beta-lactamase superfamily II [Chloroflexi bacterium]|nr:MAG: Glyoxylase, beta-lactamase superfamily II [Chloroflexota bacterium]
MVKMQLGDFTVTSVSDGLIRLDGGTLFGIVPKPLWQQRIAPDRRNRIALGLNCVLIQTDRGNVLVDTGNGGKRQALMRQRFGHRSSRLLSEIKAAGLSPNDIDYVLLSHLHFDHAGGCTRLGAEDAVVPVFPKARYLIQRADWEQFRTPNGRARGSIFTDDYLPLGDSGQLDLLDGDTEVIPGVWARVTGGHTHAHQIAVMESGGQRAAFLGDLVPTQHHMAPAWITSVDSFPEETLERKQELLERANRDNWIVFFSHDPHNRAGYVDRTDDNKFRLRPVTP